MANPQINADGSVSFDSEAMEFWQASQRIWRYSARAAHPENAICGLLPEQVFNAMWEISDAVDAMARSYGGGGDIHLMIDMDRGRISKDTDYLINGRNPEFCKQLIKDMNTLRLARDWITAE